jgi:15-cis-phytoene synthase
MAVAAETTRGREAQLSHAYLVCRGIARESARNFYYAFMVLPAEKRDALSAVYAFMRHSDDLADDEKLSASEKQEKLAGWSDHMHRVFAGEVTDDPVLFALADARRNFEIPVDLLDKLVQGTAMDAEQQPDSTAPVALYRTFEELQNYCYHVASVVGLICIKVFGYKDSAAEPLAERCGLAFQLTNIIRDVREDAIMGRVYLPAEDLARFERSAAELSPQALRNGFDASRFRPVLELEAQRAREYYRAADELIPLIDEDCRPALWVLIEIYRRLLEKIAAGGFNVFGPKVRLSTLEKLRVVARGLWRSVVPFG